MPRLYNKRDGNIPVEAINIGWPGKWGNRHPIGWCRHCRVTHSRAECIAAHKADLTEADKAAIRRELKGCDLVCWCHPLACHGDTLLEIANAE